ncbi:MAG: L-seryl-tRNA(Sec) selenium transferase [Isosphaeraceae bacterium]
MSRDVLRQLPPVNSVLQQRELDPLRNTYSREVLVRAVQAALEEARLSLRDGQSAVLEACLLARRAREILQGRKPSLRRVINATGILLHTGLGRAPLAEEAVQAVATVARGYCNLEFKLEEGDRGQRTLGVAALLREITGAEAATVVNNNAGATVLALRALAAGREVVVSRGQLVEIGGSFRLPEIFEVSGARLREVGTTNKTRLADYAAAISPDTAVILRVHHSNYQIVGFTEEAPLGDLIRLAHEHGLVLIDDIGSGALAPGLPPGLRNEPHVAEGIVKGADLVLFSGDKLLGGPQCGVLVGTSAVVRRIESDPLMRALRVDKMTLAALEATLLLIRDTRQGGPRIPFWRMLSLSLPDLAARAERFATSLRDELNLDARVTESESFIGGGSAPVQPIPSVVVQVYPPYPAPFDSEAAWAKALRMGEPPVVPRVTRGVVVFDFRTVESSEEPNLLDAIRRTCQDQGPSLGLNGPPRER